ncbi:MAG: hypothetical protein ABFD18_06100 [Syntrophomonas sp.]
MSDIITPKGFGKQMERALLRDLAQFWNDRQSRFDDQDSDRFNQMVKQLLDDLQAGALNKNEVHKSLKILDEERIRMETNSNSLFYQRGFTDGIKFILQTLIVE